VALTIGITGECSCGATSRSGRRKGSLSILCNFADSNEDPVVVPRHQVFDVGTLRVGVFGLTMPATSTTTKAVNVLGLALPDNIPRETAQILRDLKADVVVLLSHIGLTTSDKSLARGFDDIDLVVDGHSHVNVSCELPNARSTIVVQAGGWRR
jgi:2',3'-cyclic-nucleotide 2'-phosphodiesterase (5'-nucleotidase family)